MELGSIHVVLVALVTSFLGVLPILVGLRLIKNSGSVISVFFVSIIAAMVQIVCLSAVGYFVSDGFLGFKLPPFTATTILTFIFGVISIFVVLAYCFETYVHASKG